MGWRIVTYRLPSDGGSSQRVAVWRELRRVGAVALQAATWAVPGGDGFDEGVEKAVRLVERAEGTALVLDVDDTSPSLADLEAAYCAQRDEEWAEFAAECDKAVAELAAEVAKEKFTLAELDEEEHNVDRLRRWYRELRAKDLFGASLAGPAETKLKEAVAALDDFADRVHRARQRP
ncbi:MAG TPA: Chromate resistance protein ChrB [Acidimicrobiales bacterium]|nr:Chromate resistance protein ChrB [Acidimicrobiales bacterium]